MNEQLHTPSLAMLIGRRSDLVLLDRLKPLKVPVKGQKKFLIGTDGMVTNRMLEYIQHFDLRPSRLYFGNEFCERLLPAAGETQEAMEETRRRGISFSLVLPVLTEPYLARAMKLVNMVADSADEETEIVINDLGLLRRIHTDHPGLTLVFGRLMNKLKRMPRFDRTTIARVISQEQLKALGSCSLSHPPYADFLLRNGVNRIEFDSVIQGIRLGETPLKASIYLPWAAVTTTRHCETGSMSLPFEDKFDLPPKCKQECRKIQMERLNELKMPIQLWRGNTVFMHVTPETPQEFYIKGFDRIVCQPQLPM